MSSSHALPGEGAPRGARALSGRSCPLSKLQLEALAFALAYAVLLEQQLALEEDRSEPSGAPEAPAQRREQSERPVSRPAGWLPPACLDTLWNKSDMRPSGPSREVELGRAAEEAWDGFEAPPASLADDAVQLSAGSSSPPRDSEKRGHAPRDEPPGVPVAAAGSTGSRRPVSFLPRPAGSGAVAPPEAPGLV